MSDGKNQTTVVPGPWQQPVVTPEHNRGGGDPPDGDMRERLARLEGVLDGLKMAIEGLRHGQNLILGLMGIGVAIIVAILVYMITRIDNLPADFERMNQTLSSAITAAQASQPQVVVMPVPTAAAPAQAPHPRAKPRHHVVAD